MVERRPDGAGGLALDPRAERVARATRLVARPLYRFTYPVRAEGLDNIPSGGPAILAANHISFFDSIVLMLSLSRRARFVGKAEYLDSWRTRYLFPAMGMIPIERQAGRDAMAALETAAGVLRRGELLGIYPEGTRSRDGRLHRGHTGVAHLALMTGAPIVPIGLVGTDRIQPVGARVPRPFRRAFVRIGEPIDPEAYGGANRRRRQKITDDLMEAIRMLSGQATSPDFAGDEPPLVRGGTESVYEVLTVGGRSPLDWRSAAQRAVGSVCERWDDARVGEVGSFSLRPNEDGTVVFAAEIKVSIKHRGSRNGS